MKKILVLMIALVMLFTLAACGSSASAEGSVSAETSESAEGHIYSDAEVVDSLSGGGQKIGEVSIIRAASSDVTDEAIEDWFFNYVQKNDFDYCLIVYTDRENEGVYSSGSMVSKDVPLEEASDGTYMTAGEGTDYIAKEGHLVPLG